MKTDKTLESKSLNLNLPNCEIVVSTVQYTSVPHCTLNFEGPQLGYGFLSIILVLEKCIFGSLKDLEKS